MQMHRDAVDEINPECPEYLREAATRVWDQVLSAGPVHGFRNAQATVLAPTGTISFMMDCDTTGIEPDIALVKYKQLAGGGMLKIVNQTVPLALSTAGYDQPQIGSILAYIDEHDTIEGSPDLKEEHLPIFDCAFMPRNGKRSNPDEAMTLTDLVGCLLADDPAERPSAEGAMQAIGALLDPEDLGPAVTGDDDGSHEPAGSAAVALKIDPQVGVRDVEEDVADGLDHDPSARRGDVGQRHRLGAVVRRRSGERNRERPAAVEREPDRDLGDLQRRRRGAGDVPAHREPTAAVHRLRG